LSTRNSRVLPSLAAVASCVIVAAIFEEGSVARQAPSTSIPLKNLSGIVTVGDGLRSHGVIDATEFIFLGAPDPAKALEVAFARTSRVILLKGDYAFVRPFVSNKSEIALECDPGANLEIANLQPIGLFELNGDGVRLAGLDVTIDTPVADQAAVVIRGKNSIVERGRFETTVACDPLHPQVMLRYDAAVKKLVTQCLWLPNVGVTCLQSTDGNGLTFLANEISNGIDGGFPEGFATRGCFRGLDLTREEWSTISNNKFFGLGTPVTSKVDSILRYQGTGTTEAGHLVISSNLFEAIASDHMIWLRACSWFHITSNIIGPATSFPDQLGEGAIVVVAENGADGGQHSGPGHIVANNIHNSVAEDSDATAIYLEGTDCTTVESNSFDFQRGKHVIHVDAGSCREAVIRSNRFMGWLGLGPLPISPLRITSEPCDALIVGGNDFRGFSGPLFIGNPTGPKLFLRGLIDLSDRAAPDASTKIENLSTNVDFGTP